MIDSCFMDKSHILNIRENENAEVIDINEAF